MKIGYPCINLAIGCKGNRTFRLKSLSERRLIETTAQNLTCLRQILGFNVEHDILFFRITSRLVPFASHPRCQVRWQKHFEQELQEIGRFIRKHSCRISLHPDQFILINSIDKKVLSRSLRELEYHAEILDLMGLDHTAKIQIHIGGVYGDKDRSTKRFITRYDRLDETIRQRLVIENDDKRFSLGDCMKIHHITGVPVLLDILHHKCKNLEESMPEAIKLSTQTWMEKDGLPMVDYSSQQIGEPTGKHATNIDLKDFQVFLQETSPLDFDVMLEIKDKETSALKAVQLASCDPRFVTFARASNEECTSKDEATSFLHSSP
jgi:UV DNA damage endonuclease